MKQEDSDLLSLAFTPQMVNAPARYPEIATCTKEGIQLKPFRQTRLLDYQGTIFYHYSKYF